MDPGSLPGSRPGSRPGNVVVPALRRISDTLSTYFSAYGDNPADDDLVQSHSKVKIRFQSFFMLITNQPLFFASSYSASVKAPTLVSGNPSAGP